MDRSEQGQTGSPWRDWEIALVVAAYLDMLQKERAGQPYVKKEVLRELGAVLPARSRGSIEWKLQNISAVLDETGAPWIDGYKPRSNYQRDLADAVRSALTDHRRIGESLEVYGGTALPPAQPHPLATDDVLVSPPGRGQRGANRGSSVGLSGGTIRALRDFQTKPLGDAGEEWVVGLEREQLSRLGRRDLAERVEWTARERGDGFGYDVASYFPDGRERLIEVKTTTLGVRTPFYITKGEVSFSERRPDAFSLYRVHGFARDPRVYVLDGSVRERAELEPQVYLGIPF